MAWQHLEVNRLLRRDVVHLLISNGIINNTQPTTVHNHFWAKALVGPGPSICLTAHIYVGLTGFLELGDMATPKIGLDLNLPQF